MNRHPDESSGTPQMIAVRYAAQTHVGMVRAACEDALTIGQWAGISHGATMSGERTIAADEVLGFAVIDGMGGHSGGADAAALVATALPALQHTAVSEIGNELESLSDRIAAAGRAWGTPDMGATFAMIRISATGVTVFNLGDCRVIRVLDGVLGELTVEDRTPNPVIAGQSLVTQSLGGVARALDPHLLEIAHPTGTSRYLLSSDGLHHEVESTVVAGALAVAAPDHAVSLLSTAALSAGAPDNFTMAVVDVTVPSDDATRGEKRDT